MDIKIPVVEEYVRLGIYMDIKILVVEEYVRWG